MMLMVFIGSAMGQVYLPAANPASEVRSGHARFTFLFPNVVRMEWSQDGKFEDHASLVFVNRQQAAPTLRVHRSKGWMTVETDALTLRYRTGSGKFVPGNLQIAYKSKDNKTVIWHPGLKNGLNLGGTTMTLDDTNGSVPLGKGLLSRSGWSLIDDTERPLLDSSPWPWALARPVTPHQDWYFFGYGANYLLALREFVELSGRIPLPPEWAFGAWHSRYWRYTDSDLMQLGQGYRNHRIPMDVLGIDMDWHIADRPAGYQGPSWYQGTRRRQDSVHQPIGWTGYTWNRSYFPEPEAYLEWAHSKGFKTFLNLHPAAGIQPWDEQYPQMAKAMGVDPESRKDITFDLTNKQFTDNYFRIIIDPLRKQGVDFWWLDWQQFEKTPVPNLKMMWWLNYVFWSNAERSWGDKRPILYSRWSGWGGQRFGLGFSGDVRATWKSLDFQPYFTATAANVAFAYWGHDIGGYFNMDADSPELFTRWVEWGVFSPIFKVHYWINPKMNRILWHYSPYYYDILRNYYLLRYRLIPYIYTAARATYESGAAFVHPLYYDWPANDQAYEFKDEYCFGPDMVVRPITHPMKPDSLFADQRLWIPPGQWFEWQTGNLLDGGTGGVVTNRAYTLAETPILVRAGAVVPEAPQMQWVGQRMTDPLIFEIFPGGDQGVGRVYEDAGDTRGYEKNRFAYTKLEYHRTGQRLIAEILPEQGTYSGMQEKRGYEIKLPMSWPPSSVTINGSPVPYHPGYDEKHLAGAWRYDGNRAMTVIYTPEEDVHGKLSIEAVFSSADSKPLEGIPATIDDLTSVFHFARSHNWPDWDYHLDRLAREAETGQEVTLNPKIAERRYAEMRSSTQTILSKLDQIIAKQPDYVGVRDLLLRFDTEQRNAPAPYR
jgi:alpha-glucosidase (family GH31 glycosyl hydrolase)